MLIGCSPFVSSRTPLSCSGSWVLAGDGCSGQGTVAGGAGPGPAVQQVLDGAEGLVEGESAVSAFGASRCSVRNAWAAVTRVTWWCQPVQERPFCAENRNDQVWPRVLCIRTLTTTTTLTIVTTGQHLQPSAPPNSKSRQNVLISVAPKPSGGLYPRVPWNYRGYFA